MIKKLTINYGNGTTGVEFFDCLMGTEEIEYRMQLLDSHGSKYKMEDSSREEWSRYLDSRMEQRKKETEEYRKLHGTTFTTDELMGK